MKVVLTPIASDRTSTVEVSGSVITVDGIPIDLSVIPIGGDAEASEDSPLVGRVTRDKCCVKYYYDLAKAEPHQSTDLNDYTFDLEFGEVPCPIVWRTNV